MSEATGLTVVSKKGDFLKRIGFGIFCSAIVGIITNLPYIKVGIVWVCHIVVLIFGRPDGADKIKDKLAPLLDKGREVVHHKIDPDLIKPKLPPMISAPINTAVAKVAEKSNAAVHTVGEGAKKLGGDIKNTGDSIADALRHRQETQEKAERETLLAAAAKLELTPDDSWSLPKLRMAVADAQAEKALRINLFARARKLGIRCDESWPTDKLRTAVETVEARHAPNGQCPFCSHPIRVSTRGQGDVRCARCDAVFTAGRARALGPPKVINRGFRF